jgi:hypothetical protein
MVGFGAGYEEKKNKYKLERKPMQLKATRAGPKTIEFVSFNISPTTSIICSRMEERSSEVQI